MTCKACGKYRSIRCEACRRRYQEDISAGRIPHQFTAAGITMTYGDWENIRWAERTAKYAYGSATSEQIFAARKAAADRMIESCIGAHLLQHKVAAESQQQRDAKDDAEMRSRYTY